MITSPDFGGPVDQLRAAQRPYRAVGGTPAKGAHLTAVASRDEAPPARSNPAAASVAEIVAAAQLGDLARLVVLSVDAERHPGGVDLVRGFASLGTAAILVDLTRGHSVAGLAGLGREQQGVAAVAAGTITFAQAIHRDRHSAAHIVPSGGFGAHAPGEQWSAHLPLTLSALKQTYECCVVEFDRASLDRLPALLDEHTAVVVAAAADEHASVAAIAAALASIGLEDVVVMQIAGTEPD